MSDGATPQRVPSGTRPVPARPALLVLLVVAAVLLMHGVASTSGCAAGMPMPTTAPGQPAMAMAMTTVGGQSGTLSGAAHASSPLWTSARGGGDVCVSLPASPWWVGVLVLVLVLVAAGTGHGDARQAVPRWRSGAWHAPPLAGTALLTRIGISRT